MEGFEVGRKIGKARRSPVSRAIGGAFDDFDAQQKLKQEYGMKLGLEKAKSSMISPVEQSQIDLNKSRSDSLRMPFKTGRKTAILNTRTGKAYEPGSNRELTQEEISSGEWMMRNQQFPPQGGLEKMTSAEASIKQIDDLKDLLTRKKSDQSFKFIGEKTPIFGDSDAQRYNIIRRDFSDRLLRLRSGAQINEAEYSRLMGMLPQFWRNSDVDIEQLDKFKNEYISLMNRISTGGIDFDEGLYEENQSGSGENSQTSNIPGSKSTGKGRTYTIIQ